MSEANQGSGAPIQPGGASAEIKADDHKRALDDLMKFKKQAQETQAKLDQILKEKEKENEKKLGEAGEFQKIIALKEQNINDLSSRLKNLQDEEQNLRQVLFDSAKLNAVRERLPGQLKRPEYMTFIDIAKVAINPDTKEIDTQSVESVVSEFLKTHPDLLKTDPIKLPGGTAMPGMKLSTAEWAKLPIAEKRKRISEVDGFKSSRK